MSTLSKGSKLIGFLSLALILAISVTSEFSAEEFKGTSASDLKRIANYLNYLYGIKVTLVLTPTPYKAFATGNMVVYLDPNVAKENPPEAIFGLLAHEWAHEALGHIPSKFFMSFMNGNDTIANNLWAQQKELEADYYAGRALALAGIKPGPFIELIKKYNREADFVHPYFRTHPSTADRIRMVLKGYYSVR